MSGLEPPLLGAPAGPLGLFGAALLGLSMGLTACTVTCLPFMGSWVLGRGQGRTAALHDTGAFLAGRVLAYSLLGTLAGALGAALMRGLASGLGNVAIGVASCLAGGALLRPALRHAARARPVAAAPPAGAPVALVRDGSAPLDRGCAARRRGARLPPLLLGASLSLTPCAPLGWLLAVCAQAGDAAAGFCHGLAFGAGAAVTPLLLVVPLVGAFGERLTAGRAWLAPWLGGGAGLVLLTLGARRLLLA